MPAAFDPYHKWLGIPPSQQPPTHYRLLGLEAFESDRDVIDAAANQRTSYLQDLAAGEHGAASQKVLNEVAAARRCLLNPNAKTAYDDELRRATTKPSAPPAPTGDPVAAAFAMPSDAAMAFDFEPAQLPLSSKSSKSSKSAKLPKPAEAKPEAPKDPKSATKLESPPNPKRKKIAIIAGAALGVLILGVTVLLAGIVAMRDSDSGKKPEPAASNTPPPRPVRTPSKTANTTPSTDTETNPDKEKEKEKEKEKPKGKSPAKPPTKTPTPAPKPPVDPATLPKLDLHFSPAGRVLIGLVDVVPFGNEQHLFYIFHVPNKPDQRFWGHAVGKDMAGWKDAPLTFPLPVAPATGSLVLDTSDADKPRLVAVFPEAAAKNEPFDLRLAVSTDKGQTWSLDPDKIKLPNLKPGANRVRVSRIKDQWLAAISFPPSDSKAKAIRVSSYVSNNLRDWTASGDINVADTSGVAGVYSIPIAGKPGTTKNVLVTESYTMQPVEFDGTTLKLIPKVTATQLERGPFAANPRVFDTAADRRTVIGLIRNLGTRNVVVSAQTSLPCDLQAAVASNGTTYFLRPLPKELEAFRTKPQTKKDLDLEAGKNALGMLSPSGDLFDIDMDIEMKDEDGKVDLTFRGLTLSLNMKDKAFHIAGKTGLVSFNKNAVRVQIVSDWNSVEIWFGNTTFSFTPSDTDQGRGNPLSLFGTGAKLKSFRLSELRPPGSDPAAAQKTP